MKTEAFSESDTTFVKHAQRVADIIKRLSSIDRPVNNISSELYTAYNQENTYNGEQDD